MSQKESPTEVFKRALAHAARSLAEQPDLEVVFSGDGPSLNGHRAVLPHPPHARRPGEKPRPPPISSGGATRHSSPWPPDSPGGSPTDLPPQWAARDHSPKQDRPEPDIYC